MEGIWFGGRVGGFLVFAQERSGREIMDLKLPKLGEGAESGTVVSLLVKEGDQVAKGQTVLELENEKAVAPIPSPASGRILKIRVKEGDKVSVGQVVLTLESGGSASETGGKEESSKRRPAARSVPEVEPEAPTEAGDVEEDRPEAQAESEADAGSEETEEEATLVAKPAASPAIRKLARELGLDLRKIRGSERGGRIVMADLRAYIERLQKLAAKAGKTKPEPPPRPAVAQAPAAVDFSAWGPISRKPLTSLRQVISRRMLESWTSIPHVYQFEEADVTSVLEFRKRWAPAYEKQGAKLTLTGFVLKALAATLRKHPIFNASLDEAAQQIVFKDYVHVGIAVDTEAGLLVPVIREVDKKSLLQLSKDLSDVAQRARERKIGLEEMKGGSFTISNQGGIGGAHFTPIINRPEVAILGVGKGIQKPAVREGKVVVRSFLPLCVSYDHRLIDGGSAARFVAELQAALEAFQEADVRL